MGTKQNQKNNIIMTSKTTTTIATKVFCTLQVEGTHRWPDCPIYEVDYLRDNHRHVFHIKATKAVSHNDRDTEFIVMKHNIIEYLANKYVQFHNTHKMHVFGAMSCEMIAAELLNTFELVECEVSEDGENGAIVTSTEVWLNG